MTVDNSDGRRQNDISEGITPVKKSVLNGLQVTGKVNTLK
jgi:hypothetical protein